MKLCKFSCNKGVSLLEVLVSMIILVFGVLGLAPMLVERIFETIQQMSITADANGLKLVNDEASPGALHYYGTGSPVDTDKKWRLFEDAWHSSDSNILQSDSDGYYYECRVNKSIEIETPLVGLQLVNDEDTPGNNEFYGTNGTGTKG